MTKNFDPGAAALPDSGVFGLPHSVEEARVVVMEAPFAATTSYGGGAENGPSAIFEASRQVDLFDLDTGRPYEAGIAWQEDTGGSLAALHRDARRLAAPILELGGAIEGNAALVADLKAVNEICDDANEIIYRRTTSLLDRNKLVVLVGGDHATPFGTIRAHAERYPGIGLLHIDAHADLRVAYEGFTDSHASIMHNVTSRLPNVGKLVQVGIRDFSEDELKAIDASSGRIVTHFDAHLAKALFDGETFSAIAKRIVSDLPANVYVSIDIDGLDPALCPGTGTPVPGGLSFQQMNHLLRTLVESGRTIVGCDLNEVAPGEDEWDGNVGARVLYKMIGWMLKSQSA